jgi:hypothetical protein
VVVGNWHPDKTKPGQEKSVPMRLVDKKAVGETPTGATGTVALPQSAEIVSQTDRHGKKIK